MYTRIGASRPFFSKFKFELITPMATQKHHFFTKKNDLKKSYYLALEPLDTVHFI